MDQHPQWGGGGCRSESTFHGFFVTFKVIYLSKYWKRTINKVEKKNIVHIKGGGGGVLRYVGLNPLKCIFCCFKVPLAWSKMYKYQHAKLSGNLGFCSNIPVCL